MQQQQQQTDETPDDEKAAADSNSNAIATIFMGYCAESSFVEKLFLVRLVSELKQQGLGSSVWFDKDEGVYECSSWHSDSLEAAEKCYAAVLLLSDSFFTSSHSLQVTRCLGERLHDSSDSVQLFAVSLCSSRWQLQCPQIVLKALAGRTIVCDLDSGGGGIGRVADAVRRASVFLLQRLQRFAIEFRPQLPRPLLPQQPRMQFQGKHFLTWDVADLQEWLLTLDIREYYIQQFAELGIDGYLAYSLTDAELSRIVLVDVQLVRRKIVKAMLNRLEADQRKCWNGQCRLQKPKHNSVYIACDTVRDSKACTALSKALSKRQLQVRYAKQIGDTKDEFLETTAKSMAECSHVLALITDYTPRSAIFYHTIMLAAWLDRHIVTLFISNSWLHLKPSLRAVLYDTESLDFNARPVSDSMEILRSSLSKSVPAFPTVVLESSYTDSMQQQLIPAAMLANSIPKSSIDYY